MLFIVMVFSVTILSLDLFVEQGGAAKRRYFLAHTPRPDPSQNRLISLLSTALACLCTCCPVRTIDIASSVRHPWLVYVVRAPCATASTFRHNMHAALELLRVSRHTLACCWLTLAWWPAGIPAAEAGSTLQRHGHSKSPLPFRTSQAEKHP